MGTENEFEWSGRETVKMPMCGASKKGKWKEHKTRKKCLKEYEEKTKNIINNLELIEEADWSISVEDSDTGYIEYRNGTIRLPSKSFRRNRIFRKTPLKEEEKKKIENEVETPLEEVDDVLYLLRILYDRLKTERKKQEDINEKAEDHLS